MKFRFEWTIPNLLSLVRIALIPLFAWLYLSDYLWWSVAVLVLSGATDWFDGVIARKFNQISEAGKYLDPAADKLTQVAVLACLTIRYPDLLWLLGVVVFKEVVQLSVGAVCLRKCKNIMASRWYGKWATFVFYGVMAIFLVFGDMMPPWLSWGFIILVAGLMLNALVQYLWAFYKIRRDQLREEASQKENADE